MKAAVYERYGPPNVVEVFDVPDPVIKDNEVLIKIRAATVSSGDWRIRSLDVPFGFRTLTRLIFGISRPRQPILGTELAGEIAAVGHAVRKFQVGEKVFAFPGVSGGCHAQFRAMPENGRIAPMPANLSYEEAASLCFSGTTALQFLQDKAKLQPGEKVLIIGAAGAVGSAAVQLAKHFGAHVTGVCSGANADLVRSLGADTVIDYTRDDVTKSGDTFDIIMVTAGSMPYSLCKGLLNEGGRLLLVVAGLGDTLGAPLATLGRNKKVISGPVAECVDDLFTLKALAESGAYRPVIDSVYPLDRIVEAHTRVDSGHKRGSVVVTMPHSH